MGYTCIGSATIGLRLARLKEAKWLIRKKSEPNTKPFGVGAKI